MLLLPPLAAEIIDLADLTSVEIEKAANRSKPASAETQQLVKDLWAKLKDRSAPAKPANQADRFGNDFRGGFSSK